MTSSARPEVGLQLSAEQVRREFGFSCIDTSEARLAGAEIFPFWNSDFQIWPQAGAFIVPKKKRPSARSRISAARWAAIELFAMDVDGVLTDGTVEIRSDGTEAKRFSILDGLGLVRLRRAGVAVAWISGRASGATTARATELKVDHLIQGRTDKLAALQELAASLKLSAAQICYMGDDDIDAPAIAWAGIGVAPVAAMAPALSAADFVPARLAGLGAVRLVCEQILAARGLPPAS